MSKSTLKSILKQLECDKAYQFYKKYIFNKEKQKLLEMHGFSIPGSVSSSDWELFAAILVGRKAAAGYGADLEGLEIKSAQMGSSFEYQYHKHTGLEKLKDDMKVNHLFIS